MNENAGFPRPSFRRHLAQVRQLLGGVALFVLCAFLIFLPLSSVLAQATSQTAGATGYDYTVQPNDTWSTVAFRTGVPVAELKAANPQALRRNGWLLIGEKLHIPSEQNIQTQVYIVKPGEGWGIIAEKFGISVGLLQALNSRSIRSGYVLYRGERLLIPVAAPAQQSTVTSQAAAQGATANATPTVQATVAVTQTPNAIEAAQASLATQTAEAAVAAKATTEAQATTAAQATTTAKTTAEAKATTEAETAAKAQTAAAATAAAKATTEAEVAAKATTDAETKAKTAAEATTAAKATSESEAAAKAQTEAEATAAAKATTEAEAAAKATTDAQAAEATKQAEAAATTAASATAAASQATGTLTSTVATTATKPITSTAASTCPENFTDYPNLLLATLNSSNGVTALRNFLKKCGAGETNGVLVKDLNGDGAEDVLLLYKNPKSATNTPQTDLLVLDGSKQGFTIGHHARAAGEVHLLSTGDINGDKQPDVAWSDTTCGASTCFDSVEVYSWTGKEWAPWVKEAIAMAYPQITLEDINKEGQGKEIVVKGGVYGSVGAGPQRGRTEVWGSIKGEPYSLLSKTYDASTCLYHAVLDANEAFLKGTGDNFAAAEKLYTKAATDKKLTKCWVRENELDELRSFSLFRLALVAAYQGKPAAATDVINSLTSTYSNTVYAKVGEVWKTSYMQGNDIGGACAATNEFAKNTPEAWQILADYGYANPTFSASEVCPVLDVDVPKSATSPASQVGVTHPVTPTASAAVTTTKPATQANTSASTANATPTAQAGQATPTVNASKPPTQTTAAGAQTGLAPCPKDLGGYTTTITAVLKAAGDDAAKVEQWMRSCGALDDKRGAFKMVDLNGDGRKDVIFLPTIVSDRGFGPNGAQGAVLIYHAEQDGSYKLVDQPEIYGQPALLSTADLNGDGKTDLAWTVEGCSTFCVLEAQIVSWDGKSYTTTIQPGAVIAVGSAKFEPVASGDPGQGQQLVLTGGVSGTPEGGLAVPHTEVWESVKGGPFQRIRWTYNRKVEGNDCLGLRLVEADAALQASSVLGYKPAIDLYTQSLDPKLKACSIFGMAADQELVLLQGLASFRLLQAQALSGDATAAQATSATLTKGQPDSQYTAAAKQWLERYTADKDAKKACAAVQPIFDKNEDLWKITDHFGYNHPALAAEQVCYKG
ncbi:MAG: LysM peptidoglycan-binding domain-containing protein [Caldilineaceae bacterium]